MKYFRLFRDDPAFSPLGFGSNAARWNHKMIPVIYASNFSSIAINELYSIKGSIVAKSVWILCTFEIKASIFELNTNNLPKDWNVRPWPKSTQNLGTEWAKSMPSVGLTVPSARLNLSAYPEEHNLLINPLHPAFLKMVSVSKTEVFNFQLNQD